MYFILIGGLVAIVAGLWFVSQGRKRMRRYAEFKANSAQTTAVVTDLRFRRTRRGVDDEREAYWVPVVRFELPDGRTMEAESMVGSTPTPFDAGDEVPVSYDPADPSRVSVTEGLAQPSTLGGLHVALGIFMALFGVGFVGLWFLVKVVFGLPV